MAFECGKFVFLACLKSAKYRYRACSVRSFYVIQRSCNQEKLTIELLPEVKTLLESGEIKHRKHPGIRDVQPVTLPEVLRTAVYNIISDEGERLFLKEAEKLCKHLSYRRKPTEKEEVDKKINDMFPEFDGDYEKLPYVLPNSMLKELKKRIYLELGRWKPIDYDHHTCLAYLAGRLAPNYASVSHVFGELKKHAPTFKPKTYFDFGSGVGSALWAAHSHWSDSIKEYFCSDISPDMNDLCQSLITDEMSGEKHIGPVFFRQFLPASETAKYDLVVSAFSLLELPNTAERLKVIDILWRKTKDFLVVVEYGTVAGFSCVLEARDFILMVENDSSPEFSSYNSGAHVISPCPHDFPCPKFKEKSNSSCAFFVPYHPQFPRKQSQSIFKDWMSYAIIKKGPRSDDCQTLPRIVKPVLKRSKHVVCRFCCSDGNLKEVVVTKARHGRHAYRCARESDQGDILPITITPEEFSSNGK